MDCLQTKLGNIIPRIGSALPRTLIRSELLGLRVIMILAVGASFQSTISNPR